MKATCLGLGGGFVARDGGHQLAAHVHQLLRRGEAHLRRWEECVRVSNKGKRRRAVSAAAALDAHA
jgi:hypothetical protein